MSSLNKRTDRTLAILLALTLSAASRGQVAWAKPDSSPQQPTPSSQTQTPAAAAPAPQTSAADAAQAPSAPPASQPLPPGAAPGSTPGHVTFYAPVPGKKNKTEYVGPKTLVELAPTPLLDEEGRQRVDPDGKPMFNPPVRQQRDKRGNPLFDDNGKPVMQTPQDMGYDEKGKKIHVRVQKPPKTISVSIERGILTVDGMAGKAGLNYEIKDLKFIYLYAPWVGIAIVSHSPFPGAVEQKGAFDDKTLTVTVDTHKLQLYSDKRLLGKKPESAFVAVDRNFKLPAQFPVVGYGETLKPPYAWPGSRENASLKGAPPPLPANLRPVILLQPCPPGQMRMPGRTPLPGENLPPQPCVPIQKALPGVGAPKVADTKTPDTKTASAPASPATPAPAALATPTPPPPPAAAPAPDAATPPPTPAAAPPNR